MKRKVPSLERLNKSRQQPTFPNNITGISGKIHGSELRPPSIYKPTYQSTTYITPFNKDSNNIDSVVLHLSVNRTSFPIKFCYNKLHNKKHNNTIYNSNARLITHVAMHNLTDFSESLQIIVSDINAYINGVNVISYYVGKDNSKVGSLLTVLELMSMSFVLNRGNVEVCGDIFMKELDTISASIIDNYT